MNGGELVVLKMLELGVKHIFTLCGGHISPILKASYGHGLRVVDFRDERNAAFAAMGTSVMTGIPGVVAVTAGPGLTNAFTAIKTAMHAQVPLVVLGGAAPTFLKGRGSLQDTEQIGYMRGGKAVKMARTVKKMCDIPDAIVEAFSTAQSGVPGPVFLEFPMDILYGPDVKSDDFSSEEYKKGILKSCGKGPLGFLKRRYVERTFRKMWREPTANTRPTSWISRPQLQQKNLVSALKLINLSAKPVLLVGSQIIWSEKRRQTGKILETLSLPVFLSGLARGALPPNSQISFRHSRELALKEADLVILAGVAPDFRLKYGESVNKKAVVLRIDLDPNYLDNNLRRFEEVSVKSDVGVALERLSVLRSDLLPPRISSWIATLQKAEKAKIAVIEERSKISTFAVNPLNVFLEINKFIKGNTIIVVDGGDFVGIAAKVLQPTGLGKWIDAGPFGTLGAGAGFAIAAKLANPDSEIVVIFGDGAFGYSAIEFDTIAKFKIPILSVIGNDGAWGQIKRSDESVYGKGNSVATQIGYRRYDLLVEAIGAYSEYVENPEELSEAILRSFSVMRAGRPVVLNIKIGETDFRRGSVAM